MSEAPVAIDRGFLVLALLLFLPTATFALALPLAGIVPYTSPCPSCLKAHFI
jgi:hypothetical protein